MKVSLDIKMIILIFLGILSFIFCSKININDNLRVVAYQGDSSEVRKLLDRDANVNARNEYGNTALMIAGMEGHTETVKALIAGNADVNAKTTGGMTALLVAESQGYGEIAELLKNAGAGQ